MVFLMYNLGMMMCFLLFILQTALFAAECPNEEPVVAPRDALEGMPIPSPQSTLSVDEAVELITQKHKGSGAMKIKALMNLTNFDSPQVMLASCLAVSAGLSQDIAQSAFITCFAYGKLDMSTVDNTFQEIIWSSFAGFNAYFVDSQMYFRGMPSLKLLRTALRSFFAIEPSKNLAFRSIFNMSGAIVHLGDALRQKDHNILHAIYLKRCDGGALSVKMELSNRFDDNKRLFDATKAKLCEVGAFLPDFLYTVRTDWQIECIQELGALCLQLHENINAMREKMQYFAAQPA